MRPPRLNMAQRTASKNFQGTPVLRRSITMTWLTKNTTSATPAGERLAGLWRQPGILAIPGAHKALAAILAERAGFKTIYLSGAALSGRLGLADLGLIGIEELRFFTRAITHVTDLPLIGDIDTGFRG